MMCGIAGYKTAQSGHHINHTMLRTMSQSLFHRGPDDEGMWTSPDQTVALLARRLSIVDTSKAGAQPMMDASGQYVLVFNGEIYNFRALKTLLVSYGHTFSSDADTEVVLAAFKQWGIECVSRFDGDFAFALFDRGTQELYCARDSIGVKPLYFSLQGDTFSFASEIKALWHLPWMEKKISPRGVYHYLTYLVTPAPMTIYEGVYKLPAGFYIKVDKDNNTSFTQWYDPKNNLSFGPEFQKKSYNVAHVTDLLSQAVHKRMQADVPVGALLSGGLDSSLIVALMAQVHTKLKTFTISFEHDEREERSWARKVAKKFGTDHHELIITEQDAFSFFNKMVYFQDEPLGDSVCIPLYFVSKLAQEAGVKVVQVGEGSDELFCGYPMYVDYLNIHRSWKLTQDYIPSIAKKGLFLAARPFYANNPNKQDMIRSWAYDRDLFWGGVRVFSEGWKQQIFHGQMSDEIDPIIEKIYPGFPQDGDSYDVTDYHREQYVRHNPQADFYSVMTYIELKNRLPELLLTRTDKMTMAASVEARVPFLDTALVEYMLQVPVKYKYHNEQTKYLLKRVAEGLLPHEIIYRKKVGFASPVTQWFKQGTLFNDHLRDSLRSGAWSEMFDVAKIDRMIEYNKTSQINYSYQLWALQNIVAY